MAVNNFTDLEVWQLGSSIAKDIFLLWEKIDLKGYYALRDQMQRAAVSIPSNIAEGKERKSSTEFVRYLYISKGSIAELRTQLHIFKELKISKGIDVDDLVKCTTTLSKKIQHLISAIYKGRQD